MALLGPELYGDERTVYGALPWAALSANPMHAVVIYPGMVSLSWSWPTVPGIQSFRIVRNQVGDPTHHTDGTVVFTLDALPEGTSASSAADYIGLVSGRWAYYAAFVKIAGGWRRIGRTSVLIPGRSQRVNYGTNEDPVHFPDNTLDNTLLGMLPPVYTSRAQDSIGAPDDRMPLARMLAALSMTAEEARTISDRLLPSASKEDLPPGLLGPSFQQLGMKPEWGLSIRDQKRVLREANSIQRERGTANGLQNYVESLTGWAPEVAMSENVLRYADSSVFATGIGEWRAVQMGGTVPTITKVDATTFAPPVDADWPITTAAKILGDKGRIELPAYGWELDDENPAQLFPVKPNTIYTVSGWFRPGTGATTSYSKSVNMYVRGWRNKAKSHAQTWPSTLIYDVLTGEWKIDEPSYFPRVTDSTFVLPSGTNAWQRRSITFNTGPNVYFVSFAIMWETGSALSDWAMTGFQLEEGEEAGIVKPPKTAIVTVSPTRTNLIHNPTFNGGSTDDWTLTGCTGSAGSSTPEDAMTTSSLSVNAAGTWSLSTTVTPNLRSDTNLSLVASAYLSGGGATGYSASLTISVGGMPLEPPVWEDSEITWGGSNATWGGSIFDEGTRERSVLLSTAPTPRLVDTVTIESGTATISTREPHGLAVGQSVAMNGPIDGTRPVDRVLSDTVFTQALAEADHAYGPVECSATTVVPVTGDEWVRPEVIMDLAPGAWDSVTVTLSGDSVSDLLVSATCLELGTVVAGDYFDGDTPGQYGCEWRGEAHASESDMYPGLPLKRVRLADTLRDYVPRMVGARVVTKGGTLIANRPADA